MKTKMKYLFPLTLVAFLFFPACQNSEFPLGDSLNSPDLKNGNYGNNKNKTIVDLSEAEQEGILYMYEREKLARDVYLDMYNFDDRKLFLNISQSEQRHMDAVYRLITFYGLEDFIGEDVPGVFTNAVLQNLYDSLQPEEGDDFLTLLSDAQELETAMMGDINLLMSETLVKNILQVYDNLLKGVEKHIVTLGAHIEKLVE